MGARRTQRGAHSVLQDLAARPLSTDPKAVPEIHALYASIQSDAAYLRPL